MRERLVADTETLNGRPASVVQMLEVAAKLKRK
jgi:hypothetical protein